MGTAALILVLLLGFGAVVHCLHMVIKQLAAGQQLTQATLESIHGALECLAQQATAIEVRLASLQPVVRHAEGIQELLGTIQTETTPELLGPHFTDLAGVLTAQKQFEADILVKLVAEKFICYYCNHTFSVDLLESISGYDYCPQHGWKRQALLNKRAA